MTNIPPTPKPPVLRALTLSLLLGAFIGALAGTAEVYAHTLTIWPLMALLEILIVIASGETLGAILTLLLRKLHSPSKTLNRLCALIASLAALYTAWIAWISNFIFYFTHNTPLPSFFLPARMSQIIRALNDLGTWDLGKTPPHGAFLTLIWFAEAFTLFTLTLRITEWKSKPAK